MAANGRATPGRRAYRRTKVSAIAGFGPANGRTDKLRADSSARLCAPSATQAADAADRYCGRPSFSIRFNVRDH